MTWRVVTAVDERRKFIEAVKHPDSPGMAALCREFGISRQTGYKWLKRYEQHGEEGLHELSRAPHHQPYAIGEQMEQWIIQARMAQPSRGGKKLRLKLMEDHPEVEHWPCVASFSSVLERNGLVVSRKTRRRVPPFGQALSLAGAPNDLWCMDHKGWWLAGNQEKCEPFTVTDQETRFLIRCVLCKGKGIAHVRPVLQAAFSEFGLPLAIRSDNGPPFASRAPLGLSELTVWLMRLGIIHERIEAGKPQQNARHERMHRTMVVEQTGPVGASLRQEQQRLSRWREEFNHERPHEALSFQTPGSLYRLSPRAMPRMLPEFEYAPALRKRKVDVHGTLRWHGHDVFLSEALRRQWLGLEASERDGVWLVWLGDILLGQFDEREHAMVWAAQMKRRSQIES